MNSKQEVTHWAWAIPFLVFGIWIVIGSLGIVEWNVRPSRRHLPYANGQHWGVTCIGLAFFGAGLAMLLQRTSAQRLARAAGIFTGFNFIIGVGWMIFFSGQVTLFDRVLVGLFMGLIVGVAVLLYFFGRGGKPSRKSRLRAASTDPTALADVYVSYGRTAQAREILVDAIQREPNRKAVLQEKIRAIDSGTSDLIKEGAKEQRILAWGIVGFFLQLPGDLLDASWLTKLGVLMWVGCVLAVAWRRLRR